MKKEDKKEITIGTTVKAIITGYVAYGILLAFIVFIIGLAVSWCLSLLPNVNYKVLSVTLSLLGVIVLYFVLRGVCKLSIYDVFKKCKTNPNNLPRIISRMNLFVLLCVVFFVVSSISILIINFNNQEKSIDLATQQYRSIHSPEFVSTLKHEMMIEFNETKTNMMISTIIMELGIVVSCFSIIPLQKKLIEEYNEF